MVALYTDPVKDQAADSEKELELELLTKEYMLGEINLEEYLRRIQKIKTRLDLRKVASRIHTGSLEGKLPK